MRAPELAISEDEAQRILEASQNVLRHYPIETTQKGIDFIALAGTLGTIYGGRAIALNLRQRAERAERQGGPAAPGNGAAAPVGTSATILASDGRPIDPTTFGVH